MTEEVKIIQKSFSVGRNFISYLQVIFLVHSVWMMRYCKLYLILSLLFFTAFVGISILYFFCEPSSLVSKQFESLVLFMRIFFSFSCYSSLMFFVCNNFFCIYFFVKRKVIFRYFKQGIKCSFILIWPCIKS